jgi:hypothetical protein
MPDNPMVTLYMVYEQCLRLEAKMDLILAKLNTLVPDDIIKGGEADVSPFMNPDTGLYDLAYYRTMHPKLEGER